jgi:hypothetical protein
MDKLTQKIYNDYKSKVSLDGMTHSVQYEMTTALLNKALAQQWQMLQDGTTDKAPPHFARLCEAKVEALIAIITDLSVVCIELFLQEPDSINYEPEDEDYIE